MRGLKSCRACLYTVTAVRVRELVVEMLIGFQHSQGNSFVMVACHPLQGRNGNAYGVDVAWVQ